MPAYPIELDLRGRRVVVVGLGPVGRRKAAGLVEAEARVVGVDPAATGDLAGVEVVAESYRAEHLTGASLVIAAATEEVNRQVVLDAKRLGVWVNSASEPVSGDFAIPATWRDGPLSLTVSTSGASPTLAATLRDRAASALGSASAVLAKLLMEVRPEVLETIADPEARRRALTEAADPRWLDLIEREGVEAARRAIREAIGLADDGHLPESSDAP